MKVFLLCGGRGTRLFPYTSLMPKALLPIKGKPVLFWIIRDLNSHGFNDIVVLANSKFSDQFLYHASALEKFYNIRIEFGFREDSVEIGTAGEILSVKDMIKDSFMVYYGDIITRLRFEKMVEAHKKRDPKPIATLAIAPRFKVSKGVVKIEDGRITGFQEKPSIPMPNWCGIGVFEPEILDKIFMGEDFSRDIMPRALANGKNINSYVFDEEYLDIGDLTSFRRASELLSS